MADAIRVTGLAEFSRNLKKIDNELPKALRIALNDVAGVVIDYAKPRVPKRSGRARKSIKAKSTRTAVRVGAGGNRAPYYPWLDFGGTIGATGPSRPFIKDGRYIYKGYFAKRDSGDLQRILEKALLKVAASAGVEVG